MTDDDSTDTDQRFQGILTPSDRAFLRGEMETTGAHGRDTSRNVRYRIRKRLAAAMRDLALLGRRLDDRDREQVIRTLSEGEEGVESLVDSVALLCRGMADVSEDTDSDVALERFLETSVRTALRDEDPTTTPDVTVRIDRDRTSVGVGEDADRSNDFAIGASTLDVSERSAQVGSQADSPTLASLWLEGVGASSDRSSTGGERNEHGSSQADDLERLFTGRHGG